MLRNEDKKLDLVLKKTHNCDRYDTVESYYMLLSFFIPLTISAGKLSNQGE